MNIRPVSNEERQLAYLWLAAVVSSLALRPIWLAVAPHLHSCVFKSIFDLPCPTCGTTRAATAFLHGDILASFAANPLAALSGVVFVVGGVVAGVWAMAGWPLPHCKLSMPVWMRFLAIGVIAANWIYLIGRS